MALAVLSMAGDAGSPEEPRWGMEAATVEAAKSGDLEGLSTAEVARALGSSEATVRSQISKARVKVRGFVERYFRSR